MTTPGLPDFPKRKSLNAKVAKYRANAEAHGRGEHTRKVRLCKACSEEGK